MMSDDVADEREQYYQGVSSSELNLINGTFLAINASSFEEEKIKRYATLLGHHVNVLNGTYLELNGTHPFISNETSEYKFVSKGHLRKSSNFTLVEMEKKECLDHSDELCAEVKEIPEYCNRIILGKRLGVRCPLSCGECNTDPIVSPIYCDDKSDLLCAFVTTPDDCTGSLFNASISEHCPRSCGLCANYTQPLNATLRTSNNLEKIVEKRALPLMYICIVGMGGFLCLLVVNFVLKSRQNKK